MKKKICFVFFKQIFKSLTLCDVISQEDAKKGLKKLEYNCFFFFVMLSIVCAI